VQSLAVPTRFTNSSATVVGIGMSRLSPKSTLLSSRLQLSVALGMYLCLSPREHVAWRHITDGAVQPDVVISIHILLDQAFCIFQ
jgi:hypothetical protein